MLIVANWKAYIEDVGRAKQLLTLGKRLARGSDIEIALAPPAPLFGLLAAAGVEPVVLVAQDLSATTGGAHTGEATAQAYAAAGATYAILGHSERRMVGETDANVADKVAHALAHAIIPIVCVGESMRDGEGQYLRFLREELRAALEPLTPKERATVDVAYEPLWAIGKTAAEAITPTDLNETVLYIRKVLAELLPGKSASRSRILYGGSVEPGNARDLAASTGIDGFLVGHASVDPAAFSALVHNLA